MTRPAAPGNPGAEPLPVACARVRVLMESYVDGVLASTDRDSADQVRAHLTTCGDCRRQHQQAVSLPFRMKALGTPTPPPSLVAGVMGLIVHTRSTPRRAWMLLAPEGLLLAFILWYLSGLDGLASLATGTLNDLQALAGWGTGAAPLPSVPAADVLLLGALIALTATAAYHLSVLARVTERDAHPTTRRPLRGQ